jgi:hypothetical protein
VLDGIENAPCGFFTDGTILAPPPKQISMAQELRRSSVKIDRFDTHRDDEVLRFSQRRILKGWPVPVSNVGEYLERSVLFAK